ncbi:hypothetical protein OL229_17810 [Neisseriaceae bacterium JH1-16]|nr:hypothetical protein [Neisseriaceae bacterium JH1-16]
MMSLPCSTTVFSCVARVTAMPRPNTKASISALITSNSGLISSLNSGESAAGLSAPCTPMSSTLGNTPEATANAAQPARMVEP